MHIWRRIEKVLYSSAPLRSGRMTLGPILVRSSGEPSIVAVPSFGPALRWPLGRLPLKGEADSVARVLLVDHYDSFTYNLYHLIAAVNGSAPRVVAHDAPLVEFGLDAVDAIVLSPGPGHQVEPTISRKASI